MHFATLLGLVLLGQAKEDAPLATAVKQQAEQFAKALVAKDAAQLAARTPAKIVAAHGGANETLAAWQKALRQSTHRGRKLDGFEVAAPTLVEKFDGVHIALAPVTLRLTVTEGKGTAKAMLLGVSTDGGKTWTFQDSFLFDPAAWAKHWPGLAKRAKLPARADIEVAPRDVRRTVFASSQANFKVAFSPAWNRDRESKAALMLVHDREAIGVDAHEFKGVLEDAVEDWLALTKQSKEHRLGPRQDLVVAGEKAVAFRMEPKNAAAGWRRITFITHQGTLFRVVGYQDEESAEFDKEYGAILDSWAFLKDYPSWWETADGKTRAYTIGGGLVRWEHKAKRWRELTFDDFNHQATDFDRASFGVFTDGASFEVRLLKAMGNQDSEADELEQWLSSDFVAPQTRRLVVPTATGNQQGVEISGLSRGRAMVRRALALVRDGVVIRLSMTYYQTHRELIQPDWEQITRTLTIDSIMAPKQPLAFSLERSFQEGRPRDSAVDAWLKSAKLVRSWPSSGQIVGLASRNPWLWLTEANADVLEHLDKRTRKRLLLPLTGRHSAAISPNGNYLAWAQDQKIHAFHTGFNVPSEFPGHTHSMTFVPDEATLLFCAKDPPATQLAGPQGRFFNTSRLVRLELRSGKKTTLIEFPLGRVEHPAISPDGKRLAVVTNRDYPRTQVVGGHLYVGNLDGNVLRQLTKDPEEITAVTWSGDGKWLYAVRRIALGTSGGVGNGGSHDLYRIDPEKGVALRLAKVGFGAKVWCVGDQLLIDVRDGFFPDGQRGFYRIGALDLEKLAAQNPAKAEPLTPPATKTIADKIRQALDQRPLTEIVATPVLMEKVAGVFAQAAKEVLGVTLDFSLSSLYPLDRLTHYDSPLDNDRHVHLGLAAYYGETLRRAAGAEWMIRPTTPLGDWSPRPLFTNNPIVEIVLPFSEVRSGAYDGAGLILLPEGLKNRVQGQKLLLVYPSSYAEEAAKKASGPGYERALAELDAGRVQEGLDLLAKELKQQPKNAALAREMVALAEAALQPELGQRLAQETVDAGVEVPYLLERSADRVSKTDPAKALNYYRRAAQGPFPTTELLLKLGHAYAAAGQRPLAESCWRRAYFGGTLPQQQDEIRRLLEMPPRAKGQFDDRFGN